MTDFIEEHINTPVRGVYDVIVAGGGPAGTAAAISAARKGAKVLLIERQNCLGGMWTSGFVNPLFDAENKDGLMKEIIDDLKSSGAWGGFWNISFNYEYMKRLLDQKCRSAGVEMLFNTAYAGLSAENGTVKGVFTQNIEGRNAYLGKIFVDATGDASLASDAGAKTFFGDENGKCQAMTLMFLVGNIPDKYSKGVMLHDIQKAAYEREGKGKSIYFDRPYLIPVPGSNFGVVQLTHMYGYNALSARDVTEATAEGRRQVIEVFEALKEYDDDFRDIVLIQTAPVLGIRESRRIDGEYTVTEEDIINGAVFRDGVTTVTFNVDIHPSGGKVQECRKVKPYQIPFRSMLPKGTVNVIAAGKIISGTHIALASYRVTGNCCAMGEAAGIAAAEASLKGIKLRDIPAETIGIR